MKFIVTAVEARRPFVEYYQRHIPGLIIVWDQGKGAWDTWKRAWATEYTEPSIRLQDDCCLTKNFVEKVTAAAAARPDEPIQFFVRAKAGRQPQSQYCPGRSWLWNQCHYLPAGIPGRLLQFCARWGKEAENPGADDYMMGLAFGQWKLNYWLNFPSAVQHAPVKSTLKHSGGLSPFYAEPELDGYPFPEHSPQLTTLAP